MISNCKKNKSNGFTLVEVLVALTILTVGLIPAFEQATTAIALSGSIRNSLIASNLAEEGVEVIRAIRDDNWFAGKNFTDLATILSVCQSGCLVQYDTETPMSLNGNPPIKIDPTTGLYQYSTGADTAFRREITVTVVSQHEIKILANITWQEQSGLKTYSVEYHLFDWLK